MSSIVSKSILSQLRNTSKQHPSRLRLLSTVAAKYPSTRDNTNADVNADVNANGTSTLSSPHHKQYLSLSPHAIYRNSNCNCSYNYNYIQYKHFSDGAPKLNTNIDQNSEDGGGTEDSTTTTLSAFELSKINRPPSVLTTSFLNDNGTPYSTGQAWFVLQNHLAGGHQIRHDDVKSLCNSVRPQSPKDAKLLEKVLKDLKRCNRFILSKELAELCVISMARGLLPPPSPESESESNGGLDGASELVSASASASPYYKVVCGLFIGRAFVNTKTGLYVSLDTDILVENALLTLHSGLDGMIEEKNEKYDEQRRELLADGRDVARSIFQTLLKRSSTPTRDMKKRAKRKYLRYLRCCSGPSPESVDVLVRICLLECLEGEEPKKGLAAAKYILNKYSENAFLGKAMDETIAIVQEAEEKLALTDEAQGDEEDSGEGEDTEG